VCAGMRSTPAHTQPLVKCVGSVKEIYHKLCDFAIHKKQGAGGQPGSLFRVTGRGRLLFVDALAVQVIGYAIFQADI
jgi:hypothetical protein